MVLWAALGPLLLSPLCPVPRLFPFKPSHAGPSHTCSSSHLVYSHTHSRLTYTCAHYLRAHPKPTPTETGRQADLTQEHCTNSHLEIALHNE